MNPRKDLSGKLAALEERLGSAHGQRYWRTLEELADSDAFHDLLRQEYPEQADVWPQALSRRRFLSLMGASLALAGLGGCSVRPAPSKTLVPYVRAPEEIVPGRPLFYATAMTLGGCGVGLLVESHMGRPTKIEGNPEHPASLGATDLYHQASILTLYDPDRSQTVTHLGQTRTWDDALRALRKALKDHQLGAGVRLLTETVVSPTLARQLGSSSRNFPRRNGISTNPSLETRHTRVPCSLLASTSTRPTTFAAPMSCCRSTLISCSRGPAVSATLLISWRAGACARPPRIPERRP
jgi:MoCo/4Fe-4S cofactor protein with predicted Tat translocation signal